MRRRIEWGGVSSVLLTGALVACGSSGGTGTPAPPVPPWLAEDFSSYTSTAQLLSDPRGVYSTGEDVCGNTAPNGSCPNADPGTISLDQAVGVNAGGHTLSQSMRYDQPAGAVCNGDGVGRNIRFPTAQVEVWVEFWVKFSPGWSSADSRATSCDPGYKFVFGRIDGGGDRWSLGIEGGTGSSSLYFIASYPPTGSTNTSIGFTNAGDDGAGVLAPAGFDPNDGQWHRYRMHWKCVSGTGVGAWWFDNTLNLNNTGISPACTDVYGLALGRNMNSGPVQNQSIWWGLVQVYITDPGW